MFVPATPPRPSPEAEDLGLHIAELVRAYREENPDVGRHDVDQALAVARASLRAELGGSEASRPVAIALVLGLMAFLGGLVFFMQQNANAPGQPVMVAVVATMVVALGVLFVLRRLR